MYCYLNSALCIAALAVSAASLSAAEPVVASPAAANAHVPAIKYESAFTGYQPFSEQKPAPWREVNDAVHRAGGHSGIFGGAGGTQAASGQASGQHAPEHKK